MDYKFPESVGQDELFLYDVVRGYLENFYHACEMAEKEGDDDEVAFWLKSAQHWQDNLRKYVKEY